MLVVYFSTLLLLFIHGHASQRFRSLEPVLPPLVYPSGGTLKLLFGYATPISIPGRIMSYSQNFQFQFSLPQNVTLFRDYFIPKSFTPRRRRRQASANMIAERSIFYQHLEEELLRRIGDPGKDCLKKSICEYAETPLKDDGGLVGEILHVLLTPEYGDGEWQDEVDNEFREAARVGRREGGGEGKSVDYCSEAYPSCPKGFGILDHISKLLDHD